MKKLYFLFLAFLFLNSSVGQIIDFPDASFKRILVSARPNNFIAQDLVGNYTNIDLNNDGEIQVTEAQAISSLGISGYNNDKVRDLTGIQQFTNLRYLYVQENNIAELNLSGLTNLLEVKYVANNTNTINLTGLLNLAELTLWRNNIENIDLSSLVNLKNLDCSVNRLSTIDLSKQTKLEVFNCSSNGFLTLDTQSQLLLKELNCSKNKISTLDLSGLNNLKILDCSINTLTDLNTYNLINLQQFNISANAIKSIEVGHLKNLEKLGCSYNLLTALDVSSLIKLHSLDCAENNLVTISVSGCVNLYDLDCSFNKITTIDASDCITLSSFDCTSNLLTSISLKNGFSYNYHHYFGLNPTLKYLCVDESEVQYYKTIVNNYGYKNCEVNTYCSFKPGGTFYEMKGNSRLDITNDGCDVNDRIFPNLHYKITDGTINGNIISDELGNYFIPVQSGIHTITPVLEHPNYFNISPTSASVTFPDTFTSFLQNFCITPNGIHNDLEITIFPIDVARPGFDASYKMVYKNKGTTTQSGSVSLTFNDAVLDFISAVPNVNKQIIDKLSWDYIDLLPFETREIVVTLNVNSPMETPSVNIGDRLSFNSLITPVTADEKPVDNSFALRQSVVGSFDPNDKTCLEGDVLTPELIGEFVHYLIRFENTGTYPAQNIVVKDLIDLSKFDISTLAPIEASHSYTTKISEENSVEFIFENINLPFDDATNDGYIAFKIKTLPTLVTGDSFTNEANIYFDYNFPILTNKATSTYKTLGNQDFEFSDYFIAFPNAVTDILNIGIKNTVELKSMSIYDILGQIVIAIPNAQKTSKIDVSKLSSGNYFLKMNTERGTSSFKFIKK